MPDYYDGAGGMQPFDVIDTFGLDFYEGNVVKYIVRWRKKDGIPDLYKARAYIDQVIMRAEAERASRVTCGVCKQELLDQSATGGKFCYGCAERCRDAEGPDHACAFCAPEAAGVPGA